MLAIYKRELKSYFQSMVGCVFVAFLLVFTGIYFVAYNLSAGYPYFSYSLAGSLIVFIVGIPLITMRSFSEERKNKTDQLLLTAPVSLWKVVLGYFYSGIFPAWMRICSDRNVPVFADRKSDYCIYQYIWYPFDPVFMERNPDTASEFGCQWAGGSSDRAYDRCFLYFPYDIEPDACRRAGSDRSCCGSHCLFCKIFFI